MADKKTSGTDNNNNMLSKNLPAELSKEDAITDFIQENSLDSLKARFGVAEEDESIRNEGFELAKTGGLIRKPRPESVLSYSATETVKISTDTESELSKVFDSAKSEHDNDNVYFGDLALEKPKSETEQTEQEEPPKKKNGRKKTEPVAEEAAQEEEKPKKRPGRPRKNPVIEKPVAEEQPDSDEEITQIVKKYNTHTKVIFVDESLDDGIKRNSDSELEEFFGDEEKGRKSWIWSRRKK